MSESKQKKPNVGSSRTTSKSGRRAARAIQEEIPPLGASSKSAGQSAESHRKDIPSSRTTSKSAGQSAEFIRKDNPSSRTTSKSAGQSTEFIRKDVPSSRTTSKSAGQSAKSIRNPSSRTTAKSGQSAKRIQKDVPRQPASKKPALPQQPISVPYRIKILSQLLARRLQHRLDPFDLTPAHFMVLNCLWRQDGLAISDIGEKVQQVGGTMTGVIDRMEERNLIVRKRDAEDRRVWRAWLTDKGKKLFSKLPPVMAQAREQLLSGISDSEIAQLVETLDKIIVNAQAEFE